MTELKTLKAIEDEYTESDKLHCVDEDHIVETMNIAHNRGHFIYDLRQEAIEWIKKLTDINYERDKKVMAAPSSYTNHFSTAALGYTKRVGKIEWIKHFFNITDSEIAEAKK